MAYGSYIRPSVLFALLALFLASCSTSRPFHVNISLCPAISVAKYANTLTHFNKGPRRNIGSVNYTAQIQGVTENCTHDEQWVTTRLKVEVGSRRMSALGNRIVTIPVFVAMTRNNAEVLSKQIHQVPLSFKSGEIRGRGVFEVPVRLSYAAALEAAPDVSAMREKTKEGDEDEGITASLKPSVYEIVVGIQLSAEDVRYNLTF